MTKTLDLDKEAKVFDKIKPNSVPETKLEVEELTK